MYAPFDLTGSVALVTGGGSGIGLGMAEALGAAGAAVALWGRDTAKLATAAAGFTAAGVEVSTHGCDVGDEEQVAAAMAATLERHGRVDTCVVNAGVGGRPVPLHQLPTAEWRRILATNLDGAMFTLRAAAGHMAGRDGGGSVITVSSLGAVEGQPRQEAYSATKGALISMTKAVAVEYARHGVRANCVLPGFIDTPMTEGSLDSDVMQDRVLRRVPVRRWGTGADFGGIAVYLASGASSYHTGDVIVVDGGYSVF